MLQRLHQSKYGRANREGYSANTLKIPFHKIIFSFAFALSLAQNASANLVADGTFTTVTLNAGYTGPALSSNLFGEFGTGTGSVLTVGSWTTSSYSFVYTPGTADTGTQASGANSGQPNEAPGQYNVASGANKGYGNTYIWGPNNGSANGLPSTSPAGGNFIASDGDSSYHGAISQTIAGGLTAGKTYALTFYWAAAQQQGVTYTSAVGSESWTVTLGNAASQTTSTYSTGAIAGEGFSGWMQQTFTFTPTSGTSSTLSFLANGPSGLPPFLLLAGVDLEVVPEFSNWMVFGGFGIACMIFETARRRRRSKDAQIA